MSKITKETRNESNKKVDKEIRYEQIKQILKDFPSGLTAKEVAVEMQSRNLIPTSERNFSAPRLTELSSNGLVKVVGKTKCEFTDRTVAVYQLNG